MHLVYMGEYHLFGLSRVRFHLTNVVLHVVVTLGVFALLMATLKRAAPATGGRLAGAFLGGLLFAVHPVHVEAVAWVASVPELTFSLFCILAFLFHVRATEHADPGASRALSILCFGLGLLAKETALVLPLLLVAYDVLFGRGSWLKSLRIYAAYSVPVLVWLALRFHALGFLAPPRFADLPTPAVSIFSVPALFLEYVRLIVWPVDLNAYRIAVSPSSSTSMRITALVLIVALAAVTIHIRRRTPLASFGIIWISLPLIGLAYVRVGRVEQALDQFLDALRLWPECPKAHYCAGLAYWQLVPGQIASQTRPEGGRSPRRTWQFEPRGPATRRGLSRSYVEGCGRPRTKYGEVELDRH